MAALQLREPAFLGRVTVHHLARELVHADMTIRYQTRVCLWDRAETWQWYRDSVATWRFAFMRGVPLIGLRGCPRCGRVHQIPLGVIRCWDCGWLWVADDDE